MELMENPIVVKTDKMIWGTNCRAMITVAVDKDRLLVEYSRITVAMNIPLAPRMHRTEKKATINLPPSSPSRGPTGRMVLIIP